MNGLRCGLPTLLLRDLACMPLTMSGQNQLYRTASQIRLTPTIIVTMNLWLFIDRLVRIAARWYCDRQKVRVYTQFVCQYAFGRRRQAPTGNMLSEALFALRRHAIGQDRPLVLSCAQRSFSPIGGIFRC